ncbi:MAG TPA: arylsulfatase [Tepidisphaeraceae bacterium]
MIFTYRRLRTLTAIITLATACMCSCRAGAQPRPATPTRPNVVLILADDMGYSDLGCYGSEIATPNIDRLAHDGVRFTQFYNQARCCPSRAALLTGRYPHQVGIGAMIDDYAKWIRDAANRPSYSDHLATDSPTLPELLRGAGYRTLMCGKWHLGYRPAEWPVHRGFDRSFALIPGAMNYYGGDSGNGPRAPMALDDQPFTPPHDGFYSTDAFADRAIEFLNEAKSKGAPFFLYLAFNAPHWPLQAPAEDIQKYKDTYDAGWQSIRQGRLRRMVDLGIVPTGSTMAPMDRGRQKPWNQLTDAQRREWSLRMSIYAAQVSRLDRNVGRVLDGLDRLGVASDTLVLFISDNGGAAEDPHRSTAGATLGTRDSFWGYARPWATVSNTPWRLHKTTAYEGGISTPAIARWPAGIPADAHGRLVREPAHLIDIMPTLLALAGATYPVTAQRHMEGQDILPMIKGQPGQADRTFRWEHEGNRAIRKGKWKLVMLGSSKNGWELYDIDADRIESHNLAADHPDIVQDLGAEYDRWAQRCGVVPWPQITAKRPAATKPAAAAR